MQVLIPSLAVRPASPLRFISTPLFVFSQVFSDDEEKMRKTAVNSSSLVI